MFRPLKTSQVVVDVGVAVVFFLAAWPVETALVTPTGMQARVGPISVALVGAAVAGVFSAALAFRRASPSLVLGLAWAGAILQMGLGRPPGVSDLAIFAALFATAAYGSRCVYWAGFASTLLGSLVITVYLTAGPLHAGGGLSWKTLPLALVMLVAAAFALLLSWTAGALVRTARRARENREAQERAEVEAATEQERVRIARDMHDVVAHSLTVVIAQADGARYAASTDQVAATEALATISRAARAALADVRLLLTQLRRSQTEGPQPTLADLEVLYAQVRAAGVELLIDIDPAPEGHPAAAVQIAIFRILQEALTNALRHGDGAAVSVHLGWHPDRVDLAVRNRVRTGAHPRDPGHGLIGMRERASLVGGRLDAATRDGVFVLSATVPIGGAV